MSDTPETDQLDLEMRDQGQMTRASYYRNKCRDLERRLSDAIRERDELKVDRDSWIQLHDDRLNELLRSRLKSDELQSKLNALGESHDKVTLAFQTAERERDVANMRLACLCDMVLGEDATDRSDDALMRGVRHVLQALEASRHDAQMFFQQLNDARAERDELQAKLDSERTTRDYLIKRGKEVEAERNQLRGQRDYARAALREAIAFRSMFDDRRFDKWDVDVWRKAAGMEDGQ